MKQKLSFLYNLKAAILATILATLLVSANLFGQSSCKLAQQAYSLRMSGHADSAVTVLEKYLLTDATNACAWYELVRSYQHMSKANPREMTDYQGKAMTAIDKAIASDPSSAYYLYYKGEIEALNVYIALNMGKENVAQELQKMEEAYLKAESLDPEYFKVKLALVEFFGSIPEEMGGSLQKANKYAEELKDKDAILAARANEILMPEDADYKAYWLELKEEYPGDLFVEEALGKVYLHYNEVENARECFEKVMEGDPSKTTLYLNLGRYYMMQAMQGVVPLDSVAPIIEKEFKKYLSTDPVNPMQAWTVSILGGIKFRTGHEEEGKIMMEEASKLDPYHSRALGVPGQNLFLGPEEHPLTIDYFFRPF